MGTSRSRGGTGCFFSAFSWARVGEWVFEEMGDRIASFFCSAACCSFGACILLALLL